MSVYVKLFLFSIESIYFLFCIIFDGIFRNGDVRLFVTDDLFEVATLPCRATNPNSFNFLVTPIYNHEQPPQPFAMPLVGANNIRPFH